MKLRIDFPDFRKEHFHIQDFMEGLPIWAGNAAMNFYQDSFRRQGYIDRRYQAWPKRKKSTLNPNDEAGRALLVKSGELRRSLHLTTGKTYFQVTSNKPYAKAHNEGATITQTITPKQRRFFWAMHAKNKSSNDTNAATAWKSLALSNTITITLPKRQYFGQSEFLERRIYHHVVRGLESALVTL